MSFENNYSRDGKHGCINKIVKLSETFELHTDVIKAKTV